MTDAEIVKVYGIEHLMDRQLDLSLMQMLEKMIEEDTEPTEEQARFFDRMIERSQQKLKEFEAVVRERCEKGALACWALAKSEGFEDLNYAPETIKYLDIEGFREADLAGKDIEEIYDGLMEKYG